MSKLLWSVTIPSYNGREFIEETLRSVLAQDPGPDKMEIVVVDNCSTDDTAQIVQRVGQGRIKLVVNEKNLGAYGNFNKCVEVAEGELVHMLHADDLVKPGFYEKFEQLFNANSDVNIISCRADVIDAVGNVMYQNNAIQSLLSPSNDISELLYTNPIFCPTVVVRKKAYDKLGGFDTRFVYTGDWEMWARIIYNLKGLSIEDVLAKYRWHVQNDSFKSMATGANVFDHERLFNKFLEQGYTIDKSKIAAVLKKIAGENYAFNSSAGNSAAAANMLTFYKRYASASDEAILVSKARLKKMFKYIRPMMPSAVIRVIKSLLK